MLSASSSQMAHSLQNLILIAISIALTPLDTFILFLAWTVQHFKHHSYIRSRTLARLHPDFQRRTILVTGVGMTKGLALARLFYQAGHDVVGADFEPGGALVCGRVSKAIKKFYRLNPPDGKKGVEPYLRDLLDIVDREGIDLWVSCSGVASAVEDGFACEVVRARTSCGVVQFDASVTRCLHEKGSFIERCRELGLTGPETVEVRNRDEAEDVLRRAPPGRSYLMKPIGVDDSARADMTLLPMPSWKDTTRHISKLKIATHTPWIVQQFIDGLEYCTHALVVQGQVLAFVACPSAELLMHYEALPADSALSQAMLQFTQTFATKSGSNFTGHLSFDFLVELDDLNHPDPADITLYPIECNPRAHTAVALFNNTSDLASAYMRVLEPPPKPSYADVVDPTRKVITPSNPQKYYWTGHDVATKLVLPLLGFITLRTSLDDLIGHIDEFLEHVVFWKDGTFELWDPMPWWWLYHVYWPLRFWEKFTRGVKWSRVNVSTGKMFEC